MRRHSSDLLLEAHVFHVVGVPVENAHGFEPIDGAIQLSLKICLALGLLWLGSLGSRHGSRRLFNTRRHRRLHLLVARFALPKAVSHVNWTVHQLIVALSSLHSSFVSIFLPAMNRSVGR